MDSTYNDALQSSDAKDAAMVDWSFGQTPLGMDPLFAQMGAEYRWDYAWNSPEFGARITRCYELSAYGALYAERSAFRNLPAVTHVVHGSWHGPSAPSRIGHAWLALDGDLVWEPITMTVCQSEAFYDTTRALPTHIHTPSEARERMLTLQHFGPWEES